jgi:roadblock/LC7 domain-containing protein
VLAGTEYAIVVSGNGGTSSSRVMLAANPTGSHAGGQSGCSSDSGANWTTLSSVDAAFSEGQLTWREQYPSYSSIKSGSRLPVYGDAQVCQTFTPLKSHYFNYVSIPLRKIGSPYYTVTSSLYKVDAYHQPTGPALCTTTLNTSSLLLTDTSWVQCRFPSGYWLSAGTEYALVISGNGGNYLNTAATRINVLGRYTRGCLLTSTDRGTSWTVFPSRDLAFYEGGPLFW